jgi:hypothetical protein|tara:strand:- start:1608 stop:2678 length:1071 start_codon:yes stop_codon:yes gene_type:complete
MKYLPLPLPTGFFCGVGLTLGISQLFAYRDRMVSFEKPANRLWCIGTIGTVVLQSVLLIKVDPMSVEVDRWSAIHYFWDAFLQGEFPYAVTTHLPNGNTPSPLPVWMMMVLPFYLLGDVGILQPVLFIIISVLIYRMFSKSSDRLILFLIITLSPAFWYETLVRSDFLSCMVLGVCAITVIHRLGSGTNSLWKLTNTTIILGLLMSTRSVLAIPAALIVAGISQNSVIRFFSLSFGAIPIFLLTLLPFYLWNSELFIANNPLILNANKSAPGLISLVLILSPILGFRIKSFQQRIFWGGFFIFLVTIIPQLWLLTKTPFSKILYEDMFDVSYLVMGLPFMLVGIIGNLNEPSNFSE